MSQKVRVNRRSSAKEGRVQKSTITHTGTESIKVSCTEYTDIQTTIPFLCYIHDTLRLGGKSLLEVCSNAEKQQFLKDCHKTLEFAFKIESWLKGWYLPSIIPIVNAMSINLKMPAMTRKYNNCIIVAPKGSGKRELLEMILAASNPKHFVILPSKMFESQLVAKGPEYFHNKIFVHEDLIIAFDGMSKKQREQLEGFWTLVLQGRYTREGTPDRQISVVALFGLASEQLDKFREELLSSTMIDRLPTYKKEVSQRLKGEIYDFRTKLLRENPQAQPPIIKLPLPDIIEDAKKVDVPFLNSKKIDDKVKEYTMDLDNYQVQTSVRGQDYIRTFMRANALLNGRDGNRGKSGVTMSDLYLYDLVHPLFLNSMGELGTENRILSLFKQNPDLSDKELMKKAGIPKATFHRYKKILHGKDLI